MLRRILLTLAEQRQLYRLIVGNAIFRRMAFRFVAGERLEDAVTVAETLQARGVASTLDYLGENVATAAEATKARDMYLAALDAIAARKITCNVSLKLTAMGIDISPDTCLGNVRAILDRAAGDDMFVRIDMEGSPYTQLTLDLFGQLWQEYRNVGAVIQAYLYRSEQDVATLNQMGARVRLCKGAYSEPPDIAFPRKADTDANYRKLAERLLGEGNYPGIATHDEAIVEHVKTYARAQGIPTAKYEFQMLYGIRRDLQERLVKEGYNLRVYVPFGNQWYPYFMRRLAERPANLLFFVSALLRR